MLKTNFSALEISRRREIWENVKDIITDLISQQDWQDWQDKFDASAYSLISPVIESVNDYITKQNLGTPLDNSKFGNLFVRNLKITIGNNKEFVNSQLMNSKTLLTETINKIK